MGESGSGDKMISEARYLYRGVSRELHEQNNGELKPKGNQFTHVFYPDEHLYPSESIFCGECEQNATVKHQLGDQVAEQGFRSAGISTTPILSRARYYATHLNDLTTTDGFVYVIDRGTLGGFGIEEEVVSELVKEPRVPEDEEVILVARDRGDLPQDIIVDIQEVTV
jgi:hypothetical protein